MPFISTTQPLRVRDASFSAIWRRDETMRLSSVGRSAAAK
jgi:hypothetical protein